MSITLLRPGYSYAICIRDYESYHLAIQQNSYQYQNSLLFSLLYPNAILNMKNLR